MNSIQMVFFKKNTELDIFMNRLKFCLNHLRSFGGGNFKSLQESTVIYRKFGG